ncbi:PREDICTED: uncharacterized protein LOC104752457 isoform X2 [Camelina sativa]|uniref:Uncharacterized protein LOC104752457 isoform X2 n=1 Tax=Camelina sativa TaxID=90675 RepID=A0ABM1R4T7_CAMSA|nr:PREDICTED: uncharacterized protein LOC104752457 isoform X2 [Camelina sativa]
MALHLARPKQRFHLNPILIRIFSTSTSRLPSQLPSNSFTEKPLVDQPRNPDDVFDRFAIRRYLREQPDETQSKVAITELPKEEKRRKAGRPKKKQLVELEQKPKDGRQSRAASISGSRMKKLSGLSSSSRNALKNHPDYICSVTHAMDVLNGLSRVKKWSPLYRASMDHLMADVAHRQAFLTFSVPEDMIRYLRYKTQKTERD